MKKFKNYIENSKEKNSGIVIYTIKCKDRDNNLKDLIEYIKENGNGGHSFEIIVDPKSESEKTFGWDGDGSDYIQDIKTEAEEIS